MTPEVCLTVDVEDWYDGMEVLGEPMARPADARSGLGGLAGHLASEPGSPRVTLFVVANYADRVADDLRALGVRVETDPATEPLGARIRRAKLEKIPHILVVGDSDVEQRSVGVNRRGSDKPERDVSVDDFRARLAQEIATRAAPESAAAR